MGEPRLSPHRCQGMRNSPAPASTASMIWRVMRSKRSLASIAAPEERLGRFGDQRDRRRQCWRRDMPVVALCAQRLLDDRIDLPPIEVAVVKGVGVVELASPTDGLDYLFQL